MLEFLEQIWSFVGGLFSHNTNVKEVIRKTEQIIPAKINTPEQKIEKNQDTETKENDNQLSEHFTFDDMTFTSHRNLLNKNRKLAESYREVLTKLANDIAEPLYEHYNGKLHVVDAFRCKELNDAVGSSDKSQHKVGEAMDFSIVGISTMEQKMEVVNWIWKESGLRWHQLLIESNGCLHIALATGTNDMQVGRFDNTTKKIKMLS